jgi:hypothetical protein
VKLPVEVAVPPGVVTEIVTAPADLAGLTAVIEVDEVTLKLVAAVEPKLTAVAPVKLVPVMTTEVPPAVGPAVGVKLVMVGTGTNVKLLDEVAVPPAVVTEIVTAPADSAGETAVIEVADVIEYDAAAVEPKLTAVVPEKLVPVMTTAIPPVVGPLVGVKLVMVGALV